ncbi:hypothetical protein L1987_57665 [Smallanthus sonchifolius]|uniref:Uncharacterized protein n=1 Tax=Smallanthus sonchifolius TaxID=185202 RepID=A0ACB9DE91_9ASTR|nr:hypothetical protein L1987_57665 [Smallanthus sonchifolius]
MVFSNSRRWWWKPTETSATARVPTEPKLYEIPPTRLLLFGSFIRKGSGENRYSGKDGWGPTRFIFPDLKPRDHDLVIING